MPKRYASGGVKPTTAVTACASMQDKVLLNQNLSHDLAMQESNTNARMDRIKRKINDDMQLHSDTTGTVLNPAPVHLTSTEVSCISSLVSAVNMLRTL